MREREIYFKELVHVIVGTAKFRICSSGWQAKNQAVFQLQDSIPSSSGNTSLCRKGRNGVEESHPHCHR